MISNTTIRIAKSPSNPSKIQSKTLGFFMRENGSGLAVWARMGVSGEVYTSSRNPSPSVVGTTDLPDWACWGRRRARRGLESAVVHPNGMPMPLGWGSPPLGQPLV